MYVWHESSRGTDLKPDACKTSCSAELHNLYYEKVLINFQAQTVYMNPLTKAEVIDGSLLDPSLAYLSLTYQTQVT